MIPLEKISMDQKTAFKALKQGHNIFLTGAAGSGKTFVLNKYVNYLKAKDIGVGVTASTGIAATHINGITIHSWSGMGIREKLKDGDLKKIAKSSRVRARMKNAKVLIIDEISMLHADQLDMIDAICRRFKNKYLPFGGLQIVLCGDFFQLPPISKDPEKESSYVYSSQAWIDAEFKVCYLDEQHRQENDELTKVLNNIRSAKTGAKDREVLATRIGADIDGIIKPTRLFSHNKEVDIINNYELSKLPDKCMSYKMRDQGNERLVEMLKSGCLAPETLYIKTGAQVMFVKNNFDKGFVNGTTGIVDGFDEESRMPIVLTYDGQRIVASPETWAIDVDDVALANIRQVPLRLAWAITIHKSQGMSLDTAEIDLSKSFEFGMGYVALSRVRSLSGMRLLGFNDLALEINSDILEVDIGLQKDSEKFIKEIAKNKNVTKLETQFNF